MGEKFFTTGDVTRILDITERQAIDWSSRAIVKPRVDAKGAGSKRVYDYKNLVEFSLTKDLLEMGLHIHKVREILDGLRSMVNWQALIGTMPKWEQQIITGFDQSLFICFRQDWSLEISFPQDFKELKESVQGHMGLLTGKGGILINLFQITERIKRGIETLP